jgi:hypothetical protein
MIWKEVAVLEITGFKMFFKQFLREHFIIFHYICRYNFYKNTY